MNRQLLGFFLLAFWVSVLTADNVININFAHMLSGLSTPNLPTNTTAAFCPASDFVASTPTPNLFQDFSVAEFTAVRDYLIRTLGLITYESVAEQGHLRVSYIWAIDYTPPPKAAVLAYLNGGVHPGRFAKAIVYHGSLTPPVVREYQVSLVGGVPASHTQTDEIPFNRRQVDENEYGYIDVVLNNASRILAPLFKSVYGVWTYDTENCVDHCFDKVDTAPRGYTLNDRKTWFWFVTKDYEGGYLSPSGFEIEIDHASLNPADWKVVRTWFNGQLFTTAESLLAAFNAGTLRLQNVTFESLWSSFDRRGRTEAKENLAPPRTYEPEGRRYTVNNNKVSYLGWEFEYQVSSSTGLNVWNAKFLGERIVYEAGVREASATYAGNSPVGARTSYLDTAWGIGGSSTQLKAGYDCPYNAYFTSVTIFRDGGEPYTVPNGLCIFETETGFPIKRHYDPLQKTRDRKWGFLGTTSGNALVIRIVTAVWNYDYFFEFVFYPTGHFEPRVSTTGYLQSSFYRPEESEYAVKIGPFTQGQLHDHILSYKLDIDVVGTANTFEMANIVPTVVNLPFFEQPHYEKKVQMVFPETEFGYRYNFSEPAMFHVVNQGAKNKWGVHKGVKISTGAFVKNVLSEESPLFKALSWSKYQLAVSVQKDSEPSSSSIYNQAIMADPHFDFDKVVLNGENIVQKDIVVWVGLGVQHLPHAEDIPNTVTPGHVASIFVSPYNLYDEETSVRLQNTWIARPSQDGKSTVFLGNPEAKSCQPKPDKVEFINPDLI